MTSRNIGISLPHKILIKRGVLEEMKDMLLEMKLGKNCTLFCDENTLVLIGNRFKDIISSDFKVVTITQKSIDINSIRELSKGIKDTDFCVAIGGGRTIDVCKYASFLVGKPWIAFPTIPSHDGVVSSRASLEENGARTSVDASEPVAIIVDLDILKNAPYRFIASGAGDCLSNVSALADWQIASKHGKDEYSKIIGGLSSLAADAVIAHAQEIADKDYHGLEVLVWSLICSGFAMNIHGSSTPASGSEHNFSHMLDSLGTKALHGEQVALGTIASLYLQGGDWTGMKRVMQKLHLPVTAKELGISDEIVIKALAGAKDVRSRHTILNELAVGEQKAREVLKATGIIS